MTRHSHYTLISGRELSKIWLSSLPQEKNVDFMFVKILPRGLFDLPAVDSCFHTEEGQQILRQRQRQSPPWGMDRRYVRSAV